MQTDLVLHALLSAVWRRKPMSGLILHSDPCSQFTSGPWQKFLKDDDNAVAESFFQLIKRERIRQKLYLTRSQAPSDMFDYVEMFLQPHASSWLQWRPLSDRVRTAGGQSGL